MSEKIFEDAKKLIDPDIYLFLYNLLKYITFKGDSKPPEILESFLKEINKQLEIKEIEINYDCDINNLINIYEFIRTQNLVFASEIFENLLIMVLSKALKIDRSEFFGKYIYNNFYFLKPEIDSNKDSKKSNEKKLSDWFIKNKPNHLLDNKKIDEILNDDLFLIDFFNSNNDKNKEQQILKHKILHLLFYIFVNRYIKTHFIYTDKISQNDTNFSYYSSMYSNISQRFGSELNMVPKNDFLTSIKGLITSAYIYYQNKHSPLMKFEKSEELVDMPYTYELSEAGVNGLNADIILRPIRVEPRIEDVELNKNNFDFFFFLELTKALIFNRNIKKISFKASIIKPIYLINFFCDLNLFQIDNIETIDISLNYLKSDADEPLAKLISIFKGLKTLNLSSNDLKSGAASLFAQLKELYRKNKTKLETLYLVNCKLDDIAFYELGELLKSKYCKLKNLYLNKNIIPSNANFLKALKKNRSLKEINIYNCEIDSEQTDAIDRIINNTNLEVLYLNDNKIHNFNDYLRIISRNSLVKKEDELNFFSTPCLSNLNMNKIECFNKNAGKVSILNEYITKNTNLFCLDMSSVLLSKLDYEENNNFNYYIINNNSKKDNHQTDKECPQLFPYKYINEINSFKDSLMKKSDKYKKSERKLCINKVNLENSRKNFEEDDKKKFDELDQKLIEDIINDPLSRHHLFLMQKAIKLIDTNINIEKNQMMINKLISYLNFKRAEKNISECEKEIKEHRLIII